jgi:hypothetical protein
MTSLCAPWATSANLCSPCNDYSLDSGLLDEKLLTASEILYQLSAQQFPGECEITIHPCSARSFNDWRHSWEPLVTPSRFLELGYWPVCGCTDWAECSCARLPAIRLPHHPVADVSEVFTSDDGILDPLAYELRSDTLVRIDGGSWSCCDDNSTITYTFGLAPPQAGVTAAAVLACELYMACDPSAFEGQCRLPLNFVTIARQGVTVTKAAGELFAPQRGRPVRFGIPEIDMFLSAYNPFGLTTQSVVLSPDDPDTARLIG